MGEGVKGKIQNLLTRAREGDVSFPMFSTRSEHGARLGDRARRSLFGAAKSITTAAAPPLCRIAHRVPTRIEAVRNRVCVTASTFVSTTKNDAVQKKDVSRALGPKRHSV